MNQPAAKDPSMDEILSSIRQIISTDDAPAKPEPATAAPEPAAAAPAAEPDADVPLSLSAEQMVAESAEPVAAPAETTPSAAEDDVDPAAFGIKSDDIGFADEEEAGADAAMAAMMDEAPEPTPEPEPASAPKLAPKAPVPPKPEVAAEAPESPLPDKKLSGDIADGLLEPAAQAASSQAFAQLNKLGFEADNGTVEGLIREMLRPMLKGWLDENLPSIVERLVQTEIERVSRGR